MSNLRIYKKFYQIINNNYTLINPYLLSVEIYNTSTSILVETPTVSQQSTGFYYFNIDTSLYNSTDLYEARWIVDYTVSSGTKNLSTFFMYDDNAIYYNTYRFGEITYEMKNNKFDIEISNNQPLIIEIKNTNG